MKTWRGFWIAPALEVVLGPYLTRFRGFPGGSDGKEADCNAGELGLIPGLGRSPGEGNGYPLQYCCLGNPTDRGAWQLQSVGSQRIEHDWVTNSHTHTHTHTHTVSIHFCWIVCKAVYPVFHTGCGSTLVLYNRISFCYLSWGSSP